MISPWQNGLIIVGTGTNVGKTVVTTAFFSALLRKKISAFPYKPIQTGAIEYGGKWVAPDPLVYMSVVEKGAYTMDKMVTYLFQEATSPHWAELETQQTISEDVILQYIGELKKEYDCVLVECAGGLFTPFNRRLEMIDLVERSQLPVILVVPDELGSIHSALTNLYALQTKKIPVFGVVLSPQNPVSQIRERDDRLLQIRIRSGISSILKLPYAGKDVDIRGLSSHLMSWAEEVKKRVYERD